MFGVSYSQAPLYYSNQNQYFLHGLARNGHGFLQDDWLVSTKDPTPIFSTLVSLTHGLGHEYLFYAYYLLLFGLYFYSLFGISGYLTGDRATTVERLCFITLFVAAHAAGLRLASTHLTGIDYAWYLQAGLAGQYVLGFALQPSVFGVLLLASVHSFCRGHPWRAMTWACAGAIIHTTYLLSAAFLTLAYMHVMFWGSPRSARVSDPADTPTEGLPPLSIRLRNAILLGAYALALVLPIVIYNLKTFGPTSAEQFAESQTILARTRIPHHAVFERWFDPPAVFQVGWMVLGTALAWGTRLFPVMVIAFGSATLLTVVQLATRSDTLSLLFPWRTTAILVPLATTVILTRLVSLFRKGIESEKAGILKATCVLVLASFFLIGLAVPIFELGYRTNPDELPLLAYVKQTAKKGDVYLLPVEVPKAPPPTKVILAYSTNFIPAPRAGKSGHLIAIDLQRFRISAGAPIFVDFKSIPYKDVEVLDWLKRIRWAEERYAKRDWSQKVHQELLDRGITHVVTTKDRDIRADFLEKAEFEDANYRLYRVTK